MCLVLCTVGCKENYTSQTETAPTSKAKSQAVRVEAIEITDEPIPIAASGTVGSKAEMNLSFKVGGIIQQVLAKETQRVKKGEILARLRTTEIDAQVMKAKQAMQKANRDLERIQKMYADTAATLENVENLTTQLTVAKADLAIAEFNQKYATIIAPVSGRILQKFSENNEWVNPGTPVFRMAANAGKDYVLNTGIADMDIVKINLGDRAEVLFDVYPEEIFLAHVTEIAEAADPRTGVFPIELTVNNKRGKLLKNGFIGKITIFPSNQRRYIKIPMNALVEGSKNRANIYIVKNGIAKKVSIRPDHIDNDFFTVSGNQMQGISQVVTDGAPYLKDGEEVNILRNPKQH